MTTYAALVTWAHGLSITGVTRDYDHTAKSTMSADMPAKLLRLPGGGTNDATATTCSGSGKRRAIDILVLVEPIGLGTPDANFDTTVTLMDAVETAIDASKPMPLTDYAISAGPQQVGGIEYWAIVASVEGQE